jgi:hypothetical protein
MPYTPPDAAAVKARFPEFADVADARITAVIEEAMRWVDESWLEADYAPAIRFLTAHMLATEGALVSPSAPTATSGPVTSDKIGDASTSWAARAGVAGRAGSDADLATTAYGERFLELRSANHPAVVVV